MAAKKSAERAAAALDPGLAKLPGAVPFLAAIAQHPDDDTARMILADWLEDHGQEARGEVIRAQCRLAKIPWWDRPRRSSLEVLEAELVRDHGSEWTSALPTIKGVRWSRVENYRRGFLDGVRVSAEAFLSCRRELFAAAPLRRLLLDNPDSHQSVYQVLHCEEMARLSALVLASSDNVASYPITGGATRPPRPTHLTNLNELAVRFGAYSDDLLPLLRGVDLPALTSLTFDARECLAVRLARCFRFWGKLTALAISAEHGSIGQAVFRSPHLSRLTSLSLTGRALVHDGGAAQTALARSDLLSRLTHLDLSSNPLGDRGVVHLARSPKPRRLLALSLHGTDLGQQGVTALASSPMLNKLEVLDLGSNRINDAGLAALVESGRLKRLVSFDLCDNHITEEGARVLSAAEGLSGSLCLDLRGNPLAPAARAAVRKRWPGALV